ncbi:ATP-dependent DNA ligase [Sutcliffiella sp. NPDC057660]|uniref:ATP-dependent DNA ligase n=1 Tax=Sutcliffiella sp. NPDC057660 TaxID=3346199 RepID=UPI0036AA6E09
MFVSPMLLQKSESASESMELINELKLDGIRLILSKFNHNIKLYTRHGNEVTYIFRDLLTLDVPEGTILDGELVVPGKNGAPDFEAAMEVFRSSKSAHFYQFCAFDVIYYKNEKITSMPLLDRKMILDSLDIEHPNFVVTKWMLGYGPEYFELTKQQGLEGICQKRKDSTYEHRRSPSWRKLINYQYDGSVSIVGLQKDKFGWLLQFSDGRAAGIMEFVPPADRKKLYKEKRLLEQSDKYYFIEPVPCTVKYRNLTKNGLLRIPSFVSWNE